MVFQQSRDHIVGGRYGVEITGKMQVDVFHGDHLCMTSARCSAFHPEARAEGRLPEGNDGFFPDMVQTHGQPDGYRGLAHSGPGWGYGCNQDQVTPGYPAFVYSGHRILAI